MSGHSKWAQIKHQKGITDLKRGRVFSKLLAAITAAARSEPDPNFNPHLRSAIEKAKENQVPNDNIERAVKHAAEAGQNMEELLFEAYGPGGVAILVEAISDNRNRTVAEIKKILNDHHGKWADIGSVRWAFEQTADKNVQAGGGWQAKFPQEMNTADRKLLAALLAALDEQTDVQRVHTNAME
jgi:YebC/PmpR family DNA-binding regulatory protein